MLRRALTRAAASAAHKAQVAPAAATVFARQSGTTSVASSWGGGTQLANDVSFTVTSGAGSASGDIESYYRGRPQDLFQTTQMMDEVHKFSKLTDFASELELSTSYEDAKLKARALYRKILRRLPYLLMTYNVHELPPLEAVRSVRSHFVRYQGVSDPAVIDKLRWQGEVVVADLARHYLTQAHVLQLLFPNPEVLPPLPNSTEAPAEGVSNFLLDFLTADSTTVRQKRIGGETFDQPVRV